MVDRYTGNVGIGTTSPSALLSVGDGTGTTAAGGIAFGGPRICIGVGQE